MNLELDAQALIDTFLAEAGETLAALEQLLLELEVRPRDEELVHALFRAAHTLKGSAAIAGFDAAGELAHALEALLERVRAQALAVTPALVTLLLRGADALRAGVAAQAAGRAGASEEHAAVLEALRGAAGEVGATGGEAAPEPPAPAAPGARTLRVDLARLDRMLDLCGEIGIARGRLAEALAGRAPRSMDELLELHREADRLCLDLEKLVMGARMVPVGPVFHAQRRAVRDLAHATGKQARVVVEGADVEVDTAVVEGIRGPVMHLVRNAMDHGVEAPARRRAAGKDPTARVTLRAHQESGSLVVEVADDGAGLDRDRIVREAQRRGLLGEVRAADEGPWWVLFEPGFTTSEAVTEVSGRGVGLDVVRRNVEALRGSISVASAPGEGTTFTLRLPLTLAIIQGFRVGVGAESFILPADRVVECVDLPADGADRARAVGVTSLRGQPLPFLRLRGRLGIPGEPPGRESVVVVRHDGGLAGLAVDALLGEIQAVAKPLPRALPPIAGVGGASVLGDGRVALVLDVASLVRESLRSPAAPASAPLNEETT